MSALKAGMIPCTSPNGSIVTQKWTPRVSTDGNAPFICPPLPPRPPLFKYSNLNPSPKQNLPHDPKGRKIPSERLKSLHLNDTPIPSPPLLAAKFLQSPTTSGSYHFTSVDPPMPIKEFVSRQQCPKLVRLKSSYHSPIGILTLTKNQIMVAMEVKNVVVVSGYDAGGSDFEIPENSEVMKFAPIQDGILSKTEFSTSDLFRMKKPPSVFIPLQSFTDPKGTVVPKDTLLFARNKRTKFPVSFLSSKHSAVIKVSSEVGVVHLNEDLLCTFSFKPENVMMPLATLVKYLPLPVKVRPFSSDDDINTISELTLSRFDVDCVLTGIVRFTASTSMPIVDIPSSLGIMLEVIRPEKENQLEGIYSTAKNDYDDFLPKIKRVGGKKSDSNIPSILPSVSTPYDDVGSDSCKFPLSSVYEEVTMKGCGYAELKPLATPKNQYALLQIPTEPTADDPEGDSLRQVTHTTPQPSAPAEPTDPGDYLRTLTLESVQTLLKAMNLSCYCESFAEEQIDGELFASLNNEMLQELGVTKSIHILRLKQVIRGMRSAKDILDAWIQP